MERGQKKSFAILSIVADGESRDAQNRVRRRQDQTARIDRHELSEP
jgi:hypothetical protein